MLAQRGKGRGLGLSMGSIQGFEFRPFDSVVPRVAHERGPMPGPPQVADRRLGRYLRRWCERHPGPL